MIRCGRLYGVIPRVEGGRLSLQSSGAGARKKNKKRRIARGVDHLLRRLADVADEKPGNRNFVCLYLIILLTVVKSCASSTLRCCSTTTASSRPWATFVFTPPTPSSSCLWAGREWWKPAVSKAASTFVFPSRPLRTGLGERSLFPNADSAG